MQAALSMQPPLKEGRAPVAQRAPKGVISGFRHGVRGSVRGVGARGSLLGVEENQAPGADRALAGVL